MILSGGVAMSDPKSLGTRLSAQNGSLDGLYAERATVTEQESQEKESSSAWRTGR